MKVDGGATNIFITCTDFQFYHFYLWDLLWRSQRFEDILNNDYVEFIFKNIFLQIR
jgi:hypothetical protein